MRNLDLEPVLIRIEEQILRERQQIGANLKAQLANAESLQEEVCNIVDQVAKQFQWDYVSLYRVDRQKQEFKLYHENPCPKEFSIERGYTQAFGMGMLGACLDKDTTLVVNEVGARDVEQYNYIGLDRDVVHSAMTIPVRMNKRTRWMLHIETREAHAFHGPDRTSIEELVALLEESLRLRAILEFNLAIAEETRQGIVMVGLEGTILWVNKAAMRILALKDDQPRHSFLSDYASADDPSAAETLSGLSSTERRHVRLLGEDGHVRPVLATRRVLEGSFDTAIWFLIDIRAREWEVDLRFCRETVADVAQQTRAPLTLVSHLVRQLPGLGESARASGESARSPASNDMEKLTKRLIDEIKKVDITFERLAKGVAIRREPLRKGERTRFNLLQCIEDVKTDLPERDRLFISVTPKGGDFWMTGDLERIEFAARSMLVHLLRMRSDNDMVAVTLESAGERIVLSLSLTNDAQTQAKRGRMRTRDIMWRAIRLAREDASLAFEAIADVIKAHGGVLETRETERANEDTAAPWIAFRITVPRSNGELQP